MGAPSTRHLGLVEVQAALAVHEERQLAVGDPVLAIALAVDEAKLAVHRGQTVVAGAHGVDEPVAGRVLVVVEIALRPLALGTGIQGIDEHARDRAWPRDLDARRPKILGHRRHLPVAGRASARRRRPRHDPLLQRPPQHPVALGAQCVRARREGVVHPHEIREERGREERVGALDGHDANAIGGGASLPGRSGHFGVSPFSGACGHEALG